MSLDEEQNRRLTGIEGDVSTLSTRVGKMETNQALVAQSLGDLKEQVGTGMLQLGDDMKEARAAEQTERAAIRKSEKEENERRERLLMKVFGLIASVIGIAGAAVTGGAYYGMQAEPEPAAIAAPAPAPANPAEPTEP